MYHFHCDDESLAWRLIGQAARLAMELGLHRHETYATIFPSDSERNKATVLFWSIYVLDRRWSFGTGMPFAMQDADIDPMLPKSVSVDARIVSHTSVLLTMPRTKQHLTSLPWWPTAPSDLECGRELRMLTPAEPL